jgi:hypothetical protein
MHAPLPPHRPDPWPEAPRRHPLDDVMHWVWAAQPKEATSDELVRKLVAACQGLISSRPLDMACRRDIVLSLMSRYTPDQFVQILRAAHPTEPDLLGVIKRIACDPLPAVVQPSIEPPEPVKVTIVRIEVGPMQPWALEIERRQAEAAGAL